MRLLALAERRSLRPEELLRRAELPIAIFTAAGGRVSYEDVDRLLGNIAVEAPPHELGLELAAVRDDEAYGVAGLVLLVSGTYRQGLIRSIDYQRLWGDGERFLISRDTGPLGVAFTHPGKSSLARAVFAECALAEVLAGARYLVDEGARPLRVEFAHAPLGDTAPLAKHFGVTPQFEQPQNRIVLSEELVDRPIHVLRDLLSSAIQTQCERALRALPEPLDFIGRVRAALRESLDENPVSTSLSQLSQRLRTSSRSLQRSLRLEGKSFQELIDEERRAIAEEMLERGAPLKEAALRVGYADPSALARARRRWTLRPAQAESNRATTSSKRGATMSGAPEGPARNGQSSQRWVENTNAERTPKA